MRRTGVLAFAVVLASAGWAAEEERPQRTLADFPVHGGNQRLSIGAEYLVHSFHSAGQMYTADDFLVVEVGIFPKAKTEYISSFSLFRLRINGKKEHVFAQTPQMVAASIKYPDWEQRTETTAVAGVGNAGVILGRPAPAARFPGDQRPAEGRVPPIRRVPNAPTDAAGGAVKKETLSPEQLLVDSAIPEGTWHTPVTGNLYFAYRGKVKSIRTLELIMAAGDEEIVLKLF